MFFACRKLLSTLSFRDPGPATAASLLSLLKHDQIRATITCHELAVQCRRLRQKRSGDPNPPYFSKSIAVQMGGVLPYKWEAYCSTNGRRTAWFPFLRSLEARKVRQYKWGAYCRTNWRCTAILFRQAVGLGVAETLPIAVATTSYCHPDRHANVVTPCF